MSGGWGKTGPDRPPRGPGVWHLGAVLIIVTALIYILHKIGAF